MRRWGIGLIAAFFAAAAVVCAMMFHQANGAPVQRNLTVELTGLPPDTSPLRIAVLGDFHVGRFGDTPERLVATVQRVNALHPDLLLLAGDFMNTPAMGGFSVAQSIAPLAGLKARLGVYAVLGNHDYDDADPASVRTSLARLGVRVLDNDAVAAGPIKIIGVSDTGSGHARLRVAMAHARKLDGAPMVFTHNPEIMAHLPQAVELAFAGHTHCGQIALPFIGPLEWKTRYGARFGCGVIRDGARTDIVTAGLGVSNVPLRFRAPPDFWVVTVVPRKRTEDQRVTAPTMD